MTTPNTSISPLAVSDINIELNYSANTARNFNDGIFRNLTGMQARTVANTVINISELSGKTAFGGIISANSSVVTSYGVIEREISLLANTDMYSPDVQWTANVVSGTPGILTINGRQASYKVIGVQEANIVANVQITAVLSYQGHVIGTAQKYINFEINSLPPNLIVSGNTTANSSVYEPTSAQTTLVATANAPGSVVVFNVTPIDAGILISGNTITFSSQATLPGQDNVRSYSILTELHFDQQVIATDQKEVVVRANYKTPDFDYTVPATTNNNFANTGTIHSSLVLTTNHVVPGANIVWSATKVSGDDAVLTVAPDQSTANLHVNVVSGSFQTKKSVYDITAVLQYSNGQFITSKTQRLTLRTGAYGLTFNSVSNATSSGYTSQTAIAAVSATYLAGTFSWNIQRVSGNTATVANTVIAGSASASVSLNRTTVGQSTSVYRINPVLSFDGVIMANVVSQATLTSERLSYTFDLSGPTSNTILGAAPVTTTIETTASHNIANGSVTWSKTSGLTQLSTSNLIATTTYTNNTIGEETFILSATLFDDQGRQVEVKNRTLSQRAYDPVINFTGANNVTRVGYINQIAVVSVNASARSGANTLVVTAVKLTGSDLVFSTSGNNSLAISTVTASQNTVGTKEGLYRLTANVTWYGVSNSKTYDVVASATKDDAGFTLSGTGETKASYNFPVVSNGSFVAAHLIPGGTVSWTRVINSGTITDTPVSNNTNYVFRTSQDSVGVATANVTVTATLKDATGQVVESKSNTVSTSATVNNPTLVLNGPASNTVTNTFNASASIVLTPTVASGLSGHTYTFSFVAVNGSATVSSNSSAALLTNTFDGAGSVSGTYDVTCNVIFNGQTIASTVRRVTVAAVCPAPTLNFSAADSFIGSFNYPVNSYAIVDASSTPAGAVITWSWNLVAGGNATQLYTELGNSRFVVNNSQSNYGGLYSQYDVTATYRTPNGSLLGQRTARIAAYSERYNPNLQWNYVNGVYSNNVVGFDETLYSSVSLQASVNPALSGHSYRITPVFSGGNFNNASISTNNTAGSATATLVNTRSVHGTNDKSATYDFYIDVVLNSQVISGQLMQRTYHTITPGVVQAPGNFSESAFVYNAPATASFSFYTDGFASNGGRWMIPSTPSQAGNYQVLVSVSSGFLTGGDPVNTWLDLNQTRQFTLTRPTQGVYTASGTYQIRNKFSGQVLGSGNWNLSAEREWSDGGVPP